jgi:dTDP-4-dehydrorhamnose 3,5-epimerase
MIASGGRTPIDRSTAPASRRFTTSGSPEMQFKQLPIAGAFLIDIEPIMDDRGFFARTWCHGEFARIGLDAELAQCNISFNAKCGTLRGMHYQVEPHAEAKLVRCIRGRIYDVVVDLRQNSPTYRNWHSEILSADNRRALFVPKGLAHGFQTLADESEVHYQMSTPYHPDCARGVRWDDPAFGITWPLAGPIMSLRDQGYPLLEGLVQ